jgi:hypothetical protein
VVKKFFGDRGTSGGPKMPGRADDLVITEELRGIFRRSGIRKLLCANEIWSDFSS